jgi:hypothetical protein
MRKVANKPNYRDDWKEEDQELLTDATDDEAQAEAQAEAVADGADGADPSDPEFTREDAECAAREAQQDEEEDDDDDDDDAYASSSDDEAAASEGGYDSAASELAGEAAAKRPPKSPEELQAEETTAGMLNLTYPEQFRAMRRNLGYLYPCVASDLTPEEAVRMAYDRIAFPEPVEPEERDEIVGEAVRLARGITMPNQVVQEAFAELSKHNGGRLVTASRRVTTLFAIVCMVRQVIKLPEYKRAGSVQSLGFAALLEVFGDGFSNGAASVPLGDAYVTDRPMDSAMAHGRADVVDRFEAMDNKLEVLGLLFGTLANLGDDASGQVVQAALRSASRPKYDRSRYDKTPVKGARAICYENGLVKVALHVVQREGAPDYVDKGVAALAEQYGSAATPFHTRYPPCDRLREPLPKLTLSQDDQACRDAMAASPTGWNEAVYVRERARFAVENRAAREAEAPRRLVVTHRNETTVRTPDGTAVGAETLMAALRGLVEDEGTKLHAHLAQAVPALKKRGFGWAGKDVHLAAYKDGKRVLFGKSKKGARNCDHALCARGGAPMPAGKWLSLESAHREEVANVVLQPWLVFAPGVWDFYLLVGSAPKDAVLEHAQVRQRMRKDHIAAKVAVTRKLAGDRWRERQATRPGTRKRKLNSEEERALERYLEEKESLATWSAQCDKEYTNIAKQRVLVQYQSSLGTFPLDHFNMSWRTTSPDYQSWWSSALAAKLRRQKEERLAARAEAVAQRAEWNKKADEWFMGSAQHAHAVAAHPDHGADVAQAATSFAANANAAARAE